MGLGPSYAEDPVFPPVAPALTRSLGPDRLSVDLRWIWGTHPGLRLGVSPEGSRPRIAD